MATDYGANYGRRLTSYCIRPAARGRRLNKTLGGLETGPMSALH